MAVNISIDGVSGLKASMGSVRERIEQELADTLETEAERVVQDARSHAREDTGDLRQMIAAEVSGMSASVRPVPERSTTQNPRDAAIKANVNEFGRQGDPGRPYMVPAAEASRARWPKVASEAVKRGARG